MIKEWKKKHVVSGEGYCGCFLS